MSGAARYRRTILHRHVAGDGTAVDRQILQRRDRRAVVGRVVRECAVDDRRLADVVDAATLCNTELPEIVLPTIVKEPRLEFKMAPPEAVELLPKMWLSITVRFLWERIAPPPPAKPPVRLSPEITTSMAFGPARVKIRELSWPSIVNSSEPGPLIVRGTTMLGNCPFKAIV